MIKSNRIGLPSFGLLMTAALVSILLGARQDQYCFGPPIHNWAWHFDRICLFAEIAAIPLAIIALFVDKKKLFAVLTLFCLIPLLIIDGLAHGCN
jgi:hypothetical protein